MAATVAPRGRENTLIREISVEQIIQAYRDKELTARDRDMLLHLKAHATLTDLIDEKGVGYAMFSQLVGNWQEGWDQFVQSMQAKGDDPAGEREGNINAAFGILKMATSAFTALGEVSGNRAEMAMLSAGASPGLARAVGAAIDIGSGFTVPVGGASRTFVRGAHKVQKFVQKAGQSKEAKAVEEGLDQIAAATKALEEGLRAEGVVAATPKAAEAEHVVAPTIVAKARQRVDAKRLQREMRERVKNITPENAKAQLGKLERKTGINVTDLKQAMNWSDEQVVAYLETIQPHAAKLKELAKRALKGDYSDQVAFARYATELYTNIPGSKTVHYSQEFMNVLRFWDPESIAKGDIAAAMQRFAEDIAALPSRSLVRHVVDNQSGFVLGADQWWPMAREFYLNLLLPFAWAPSFAGNSYATGMAVVERFVGGAFSAKLGPDHARARDAFFILKGMQMATGDAMLAFREGFKGGQTSGLGRFDFTIGQIPGPVGRIVNLPGHSLMAMDNLFKVMMMRGHLYASAMKRLDEAIASGAIKNTPHDRAMFLATVQFDKQLQIEAMRKAKEVTFQEELGKISSAFRTFIQTGGGPGVLYFPFVKSPLNLAGYVWRRTPFLQLATKSMWDDIAAGGARADEAVARLTMANLMAMYYFELAKDGKITGAGPADPALRKAWLATHQPYSIQTEKGWVPIGRGLEPANTLPGMIADYAEIASYLDEDTAQQTAMAIVLSISRNLLTNNTWFNLGVDITDAIQGIERGDFRATMGKVALGPLATVMHGGPIGARLKETGIPGLVTPDPYIREARTFVEAARAKTPGYSPTRPPIRDGYGDPIVPPQAMGSVWFGLLRPLVPSFKEHEKDRVKIEGDRLGVKLPTFPYARGGREAMQAVGAEGAETSSLIEPQAGERPPVALNAEQRDRWQQLYRNILRHPTEGIEKQVLDSPDYNDPEASTRGTQRLMFQTFVDQAKEAAWWMLLLEDKSLQQAYIRSVGEGAEPLVVPKDRPALKLDLEQSINLFDDMSPQERENLMEYGVWGENDRP